MYAEVDRAVGHLDMGIHVWMVRNFTLTDFFLS